MRSPRAPWPPRCALPDRRRLPSLLEFLQIWLYASRRNWSEVQRKMMAADGEHVITWFDLHTTVAPPAPVANWSQIRDGKIVRIRATFDPRPIIG